MVKYILVSGGVVSGVGKGLIASSVGVLLKSCGWNVTAVGLDPYLNVDAGMMNPWEDGEMYVLDDGGKVNSDMGNYERFLGIKLSSDSHVTTGKVYNQVIEKERRGDFLGKTVQVVPHVTNAIQEWIENVASTPIVQQDGTEKECDICVIELGGTVGDMESMPFMEALRQMRHRKGKDNFSSIFVSLAPSIKGHEGQSVQKTKPTQHGVKELRHLGLAPDMIVCRSEQKMDEDLKKSLSMYCQVPPTAIVNVHDISNVYRIPFVLQEQGVSNLLNKQFQLEWRLPTDLQKWQVYADRADILAPPVDRRDEQTSYALPRGSVDCVRVVVVTSSLPRFKVYDSLLSVVKALKHAGIAMETNFKIDIVAAEDLANDADAEYEDEPVSNGNRSRSPSPPPGGARETRRRRELASSWRLLRSADAVIISGMNVKSSYKSDEDEATKVSVAVEGRLNAVRHVREKGVPFLGIGVGLHVAVIESARALGGIEGANSAEFDIDCSHPVVCHATSPADEDAAGAEADAGAAAQETETETAIESSASGVHEIVGAVETKLLGGKSGSLLGRLYDAESLTERHCHSHVVNLESEPALTATGLRIVGKAGENISVVERYVSSVSN
jgi:CTP synthase